MANVGSHTIVDLTIVVKREIRREVDKTMQEKETKLKMLIRLRISEGHYETQKQIAELLDMDQPRFTRILDNPKRKLSAKQIRLLSNILGLTSGELVNVLVFDEITGDEITNQDVSLREEAADQAIFELNEIKKRLLQLELLTIADEEKKAGKYSRREIGNVD